VPKTLIVIPARLAASRLPRKPLADIAGRPMIVHVWERAVAADVGPVVVACGEREIADAVERAGGRAVLTRSDHATGSDRIAEALHRIDAERSFDKVVNVQGDVPTIEPRLISTAARLLDDTETDIGTLVSEIRDAEEITNPNVVKAAVGFAAGSRVGRALYFSRNPIPSGAGPYFHHIGIYAYRREVLERFVTMPPAVLEQRERLEQLRALVAGYTITAALVDTIPLGVDTPADLERARAVLRPGA